MNVNVTDPEQFSHVMIDTITLGNDRRSLIASLAAVPFQFETHYTYQPYFAANISLDSSLKVGMKVSGPSLQWWLNNDRKELKSFLFSSGRPLVDVMTDFRRYLLQFGKDVCVWSKGTGHDLALLKDYFRVCHLEIPWRSMNERDVRTIAAFSNAIRKRHEEEMDNLRNFPHHECMVQIAYTREIINKLGGGEYLSLML